MEVMIEKITRPDSTGFHGWHRFGLQIGVGGNSTIVLSFLKMLIILTRSIFLFRKTIILKTVGSIVRLP